MRWPLVYGPRGWLLGRKAYSVAAALGNEALFFHWLVVDGWLSLTCPTFDYVQLHWPKWGIVLVARGNKEEKKTKKKRGNFKPSDDRVSTPCNTLLTERYTLPCHPRKKVSRAAWIGWMCSIFLKRPLEDEREKGGLLLPKNVLSSSVLFSSLISMGSESGTIRPSVNLLPPLFLPSGFQFALCRTLFARFFFFVCVKNMFCPDGREASLIRFV